MKMKAFRKMLKEEIPQDENKNENEKEKEDIGTESTKIVDFDNDTNNTIDSDNESIASICEMEFDGSRLYSDEENIINKLDMRSFKELVKANAERVKMHNLALESFMDKEFLYINTFDDMVQFSRKNIIYDNSCDGHHTKESDIQFHMKDQVLSLAKNANMDPNEYVKLRFLSGRFKKYSNFKFMVIFRSWLQLMAERNKDGIHRLISLK